MYTGSKLQLDSNIEEEKKEEESKEPATANHTLSGVLFNESEISGFDYAGSDYAELTPIL